MWLAPDADETAALAVLERAGGAATARIAEVTERACACTSRARPWRRPSASRAKGELAREALRALREAGVSGVRRDEP